MTETNFELFLDITHICKIVIRTACFSFLWKICYPMKIRKSIRYILEKKDFLKVIFLNLLFWNFHSLSFLIANSAYQWIENILMQGFLVETLSDMNFVYKNMAIGMCSMFFLYTILFFAMLFGIKRWISYQKMHIRKITEFCFLSVLNIVGWMFAQMVSKLMVVKIETEVFILFDERVELLWWIPLMAICLYFGEAAVIYSNYMYFEKQQERELLFMENQQIKVLKQRLEDVEHFYGNIRKVRHEMRNHMTNIKGLVSNEEYGEVDRYIHALDTSIQALEYKFSTGNPVTDVVINDKWRQMEKLGIRLELDFQYHSSISAYDMAILLNNLLDNAIEASEKIPKESRYIRLCLKQKHRFVLLEVENVFDGNIKWEGETAIPTTLKPFTESLEHGIGLKNVKEVASRYFGDLDIKINHTIFKATVLLQEEEPYANNNTND